MIAERKYQVIFNPAAGRGLAKKLSSELTNALKDRLGAVTIHQTNSPGHAKSIAEGLKNNKDIIIAAGGDGTIHEVVNGLMEGNSILGIIPIGSGNDFVKMLNIPLDYKRAIDIIKNQTILKMDLGMAGQIYFPNGLGIGFDAEAALESQQIKRLKGFLLYFYSVLKVLLRFKNRTVTLTINGKRKTKDIFMITVGNGKCLGGGFYLTPKAKIDDGLLDVSILKALNLWDIIRYFPRILKGAHIDLPHVEYCRTTNLLIESTEDLPVHADGQILDGSLKRIEIKIIPKAIEVIHNL